jgi:hypothetical protein
MAAHQNQNDIVDCYGGCSGIVIFLRKYHQVDQYN